MPHAYTEDKLVEQPAVQVLSALGWTTVSALGEVIGSGGTLDRETSAEVVLVGRLRAALVRLNPLASSDALTLAADTLMRDRTAMNLVSANRDVYDLMKDGIAV